MCTFIYKLTHGKLQQYKLILPTKELPPSSQIFSQSDLPHNVRLWRFFVLSCFAMTSNTAMIINIGPVYVVAQLLVAYASDYRGLEWTDLLKETNEGKNS